MVPPKTRTKIRVPSKVPALRRSPVLKPRPAAAPQHYVRAKAQPSSSFVTLSLTTLGAVALIVACSPSNRGSITARPLTGLQKAIATCTDSIHVSQKLQFQNSKRAVSVCEYPVNSDGTIGKTLVATLNPVSFSVQRSDSTGKTSTAPTLQLSSKIGFLTNEALDDKAQADLVKRMDYACKADIAKIFSNSKFGTSTTLEIEPSFEFISDDPINPLPGQSTASDVNQQLHLKKGTDGVDPYWVLGQLPSQARFYPQGRAAESKACLAAGGTKVSQDECLKSHYRSANISFCAAIAKRIGNSLGIVDVANEQKLCGAIQPVTASVAPTSTAQTAKKDPDLLAGALDATKPAPSSPPDSSFAKPTSSDADFMTKATLNKKDLVTILSMPCPDLKNQDLSSAK